MERYWINYNPNRSTPVGGFTKHRSLEQCKQEAVRIMNNTGNEIFIFELVGSVEPLPNYNYHRAVDPIPF